MASTACSEACLAVYLQEKPFSVSGTLAAHVMPPLSSGRAARSRRKCQLGYFLFGSVVRSGKSEWTRTAWKWNERPRVVSFHSNRSNPENPDDRRSLAITNERDRFIGGNGEDKKSERYFEKHICCPHLPLRTTATTYKIRVIFTAVVRTATAVVYSRYPDRAAVRKERPR